MRYFRLFDSLSPDGEYYKVDPETEEAWCVDPHGNGEIPAFVLSAQFTGNTQFHELRDYASKHGRLEEIECPES